MRTLMLFVALLFLVGMANVASAQPGLQATKYMVGLVINEIDTIPGTEAGGLGAGKTGWIYVGMKDVSYSIVSIDSTHYTTVVDYADSGWSPGTATSALTTGFKSYTITTVTDSVANFANAANPKNLTSRVLRQKGYVDNIPGGRYIRFRVEAPNVASKLAAAAADRTLRLVLQTY